MSETSDAFRISLGVQIDTKNITDQIQGIKPPVIQLDIDTKDLKTKIQKAVNESYKGFGKGNIKGSKVSIDTSSIDALKAKAENIQLKINTKDFDVKIGQLRKGFKDAGLSAEEAERKLKDVASAYNTLKQAQSGSPDQIVAAEKRLNQELRTTQNNLKLARIDASGFVSTLQTVKLNNKIQSWLKNNTAATKEAREAMTQYLSQIQASGGQLSKTDYQRISGGADTWNAKMRAMGKLGNSTFATLQQGISKFTSWIGASAIVMRALNEFRNGIRTIAELDDGLTNINYTMEVSADQLKNIGNSAVKASKDLHTSVSTVMDAVKTYANANETAETIIEKSKPTIMMSNVSGMGVENTVDILQGTMEQFDLAEDKLMHISDVMQTVSASMPYDFAKGIRELSEGIQASGSVAKDSGYDLENYTALLGTLIAKTRQSGSELGRSLRTMFVRTTKASSAALASGEVTEEDLSNAEAALDRVGIQVRSDLETFRSFDDIMGDLYEKVDSLSEVDLSNIAYEVASTRQTNVFKMMIKAYGEYQDMADKAAKADGITIANQEKYAESIKGRLGELKSTGESIWNNIFNSGELKAGVGTLTTVLKLVDGITGKLKGLGTVGLGLGAFLGAKNAGGAKMSAPNNNCFKVPATICVLWDTGVFILSDVRYTLVNK